MIYSKKPNEQTWKLHHYQPESDQEQLELLEDLRVQFPTLVWTWLKTVENNYETVANREYLAFFRET